MPSENRGSSASTIQLWTELCRTAISNLRNTALVTARRWPTRRVATLMKWKRRDTGQAGVTKWGVWADSGCAAQSNRNVMDKCICSVVRNEKSIPASASRLTDRARLTKKDCYLGKSPKNLLERRSQKRFERTVTCHESPIFDVKFVDALNSELIFW